MQCLVFRYKNINLFLRLDPWLYLIIWWRLPTYIYPWEIGILLQIIMSLNASIHKCCLKYCEHGKIHWTFMGMPLWCLDQTCLLFSIIKERCLHSGAYIFYNELVVFVTFKNIKQFGKELDCSRELIITMTVML